MSKSVSLLESPKAIKALKQAVKLGPAKTKKSIRGLAWQYCLDVVREIEREQRATADSLLTAAQRRDNEVAEALRGPSRFVADATSTKIYLPEYVNFLPKKPEHGLLFVVRRGPLTGLGTANLDFVDDEKSGYYLWVDEQWAKIDTATTRNIQNAKIRNVFFEAIKKQSNLEIKQINLPRNAQIATWEFWRNQYYGRLSSDEDDGYDD